MADLLIAVGGTGQHVALAISRLVFLGALPKMELAAIDADNSNELSENLKTFGNTVERNYTEHPLINGNKIWSPFDKEVKGNPKFSEIFLSSQSLLEREIFEVCFEEKSSGIAVKDGMFGRPSVGAAIFTHNKNEQLDMIFKAARKSDTTNIFITGSMVGGTGAGLIHQLVKSLRSDGQLKNKDIYGLIFLRWLDIKPSDKKLTIDNGTLERNMRFGLKFFFDHTRRNLKASFLIGIPSTNPSKSEKLEPVTIAEGDNKEKPHYFHLLAAFGVRQLPSIVTTQDDPGAIYAASFDSTSPTHLYEETWGEKGQAKPLHWYVNRGHFVREILSYAGSPKFEKELLDAFGLLGKKDNVGRGLYEAIARYPRSERKAKVQEITKAWRKLVEQYDYSLNWLDRVLDPLPESFTVDRYKKAKDEAVKVTEIQTVWKQPMPEAGEIPSPYEVAKFFHERLVADFT